MPAKPKTIDDYLAGLTNDKRAALEKIRNAIKAAAPKAEECISYQMPAFRLDGRMLIFFAAWTNHCSIYPLSPAIAKDFQADLARYETSKGTLRFPIDNPLPATLVRKLVKARIKENEARAAKRKRG